MPLAAWLPQSRWGAAHTSLGSDRGGLHRAGRPQQLLLLLGWHHWLLGCALLLTLVDHSSKVRVLTCYVRYM